MEHGAEQLENMVISEVSGTTRKIAHEMEGGGSNADRTAEETLKEMEHMTRETIKITEIAAGAVPVPKGWGGSVERSHEWEVNC